MRRFAFTLSELLITLAIVGVVAVLTVPNVTKNVYKHSNVARVETTMKTLNDAVKNMMINERQTDIRDTVLHENVLDFYSKYLKTSKLCDTVSDCFAAKYKSIENPETELSILPNVGLKGSSAILPSGVAIYYAPSSGNSDNSNAIGHFVIDVNGQDAPNIVGRDAFTLLVTANGQVGVNTTEEYDDVLSICLEGNKGYGAACVQHLQQNSWSMDY